MKISVITAVLNDAEHIAETIESVLNQNFDDLEYIIVDGASSDGTLEIIKKYSSKIAKIISEKDSGIYEAMNKGIKAASGDIVGIINSGDRYMPGALQRVADSFAQKEENMQRIFWGDVEYENLGIVRGFREENRYRGAFAPHPSMFVPKKIYEEIGAYDESFRLLGDYDFMYRAVNTRGILPLYLPETIAFYRQGGLSDRNIVACLKDELKVKLRYGASPFVSKVVFLLKLVKNTPRIIPNILSQKK
jgi:glycosyltransferase